MRVHLIVEWLDGTILDDDTLHEVDDVDILDTAAELGCIILSDEEDADEESPFTLINVAATRLIKITPIGEPEDAKPADLQ
ncbi:MAG: hypothetical protein ACTHOG_12855 [Marmoricola sp.]